MRIAPYVCGSLLVLSSLAAAAAPVKFTTIDRGDQSNIDEPRQVIVRTAAKWTALWRVHGAPRPKPAVDFTTSTVIGVFMGSRTTGGYLIEITGIEKDGPDVVVTWREDRPAGGAILAQVLTMPYHIVTIPKHAGAITFKKAGS